MLAVETGYEATYVCFHANTRSLVHVHPFGAHSIQYRSIPCPFPARPAIISVSLLIKESKLVSFALIVTGYMYMYIV